MYCTSVKNILFTSIGGESETWLRAEWQLTVKVLPAKVKVFPHLRRVYLTAPALALCPAISLPEGRPRKRKAMAIYDLTLTRIACSTSRTLRSRASQFIRLPGLSPPSQTPLPRYDTYSVLQWKKKKCSTLAHTHTRFTKISRLENNPSF